MATVADSFRRLKTGVADRLAPLAGPLHRLADAVPAAGTGPDPGGQRPAPATMATEEDLRACYRLLLGRPPDEGGWRGYLPYIHARPTPVDDLVGFFLSSVEFRARLATTFGWSAGAPQPVDLLAGYRIWLRANDPSMAVVAHDRAYEPHVVERMAPMLAPGAVMVDVGASFGYFTVLAARAVGPAGRVVACEPGPQNQSVLLLNVVANGLANVDIHPVAVSDTAGALLYSQSGANGAVSAYTGGAEALATNDLVAARPLDEILATHSRVDVIKIDVEGAEGRVLAGAAETLARHRPALFFEFSPASLVAASGVEPPALLAGLEDLGYGIEILGAGYPAGRLWRPDEIVSLHRDGQRDHLDLLAIAQR